MFIYRRMTWRKAAKGRVQGRRGSDFGEGGIRGQQKNNGATKYNIINIINIAMKSQVDKSHPLNMINNATDK